MSKDEKEINSGKANFDDPPPRTNKLLSLMDDVFGKYFLLFWVILLAIVGYLLYKKVKRGLLRNILIILYVVFMCIPTIIYLRFLWLVTDGFKDTSHL